MSDGGLTEADIVGSWRLDTWRATDEDGGVREPFGARPMGYVMYTADGHMITTMSKPDRAATGSAILAGSTAAGSTESGSTEVGSTDPGSPAASSFMAYSGTFRIDAGDVVHTVEMSLLPDWIGTEQRRHVELSDDGTTLTLSTDPMSVDDHVLRHRLVWHRVES